MREDTPFCYIREDKCSGLVTHSHSYGIYFKGARIASKFCVKCDLRIQESINHIVMQCPFFEVDGAVMLNELNDTNNGEIKNLLTRSGEIYLYLMGNTQKNIVLTICMSSGLYQQDILLQCIRELQLEDETHVISVVKSMYPALS